jgi:group I intron endonuclease
MVLKYLLIRVQFSVYLGMKIKIGLIYVLTNKINQKKYVGFTTNLKGTISRHVNRAKNGCKYLLSNAIRKYGWENFNVEIVLESKDYKYVKDVMEPYFIKELNTFYENSQGYNMTLGGEGTFGYKRTKEEREHISKCRKGHKISEKTREKMSMATRGENNPNFGKIHSKETRAKISAANKGMKGRIWTEDDRKKASEIQKNRIRSEEEIDRIRQLGLSSKGKTGHPHTEEHKQYMSKILKGRIFSEETLKKMRESQSFSGKFICRIKSPDGKIYETYNVDKFAQYFNLCNDSLYKSFKNQKPCLKFKSKGWIMITKEKINKEDGINLKEKYGEQKWILLN